MRRTSTEVSEADATLKDYVQKFRYDCTQDFDAAIAEFKAGSFAVNDLPGADNGHAKLTTHLVLDENLLNPPLDLDGNGSFTDKAVSTASLRMAVVQMKLTWLAKGEPRVRELTGYMVRDGLTTGGSMLVETGSVTSPGGTTGTQPVSVTSASVTGNGDALTATLALDSTTGLSVVGVTVDSTVAGYVSTIQINGTKLYDARTGLSPTGSMIATTPITLSGGTATIDTIDFADTSSDTGTPQIKGTTVGVTLHLEDGSTVPFTIGL